MLVVLSIILNLRNESCNWDSNYLSLIAFSPVHQTNPQFGGYGRLSTTQSTVCWIWIELLRLYIHIEQISEIWLNLRMQTKEVSSFCFRSIVICFVLFFMWNSLGIYMVSLHHNEQCKVCRICSVIQSTVKLLSLCIGWSCVRHQPTQYTALLRKNGNYFDFRNWFALLRFFF